MKPAISAFNLNQICTRAVAITRGALGINSVATDLANKDSKSWSDTVVKLAEGSSVAGVFTANRFCAAPVQICRDHLAVGPAKRAIVINTGNANAGTGDDGLVRARSVCIALAQALDAALADTDPLLAALIQQESGGEHIDPKTGRIKVNARTGAAGITQIMPATAAKPTPKANTTA